MKRSVVIWSCFIAISAGIGYAGMQQAAKRYWQDELLQPPQAWIAAYGYRDESILAFNVKQLTLALNNQDRVDKQLAAAIRKLQDPNDTRPAIPQSGNAGGNDKPAGRNVPGVPAPSAAGGKTGGK